MNGTDENEEFLQEIEGLILSGQTIPAIKRYREETGLGLKESKAVIDEMKRELWETCPERFTVQPSGCAPVLLVGLMSLGTIVMYCSV